MVHVRQGKGGKDRCLPIRIMLSRGIRDYISAEKPRTFLFEGNDDNALSQRGTQWAVSQAVKKAGLVKEVSGTYTSPSVLYNLLLKQHGA
jgi:site-specific recombinase XerD